MNIKSFTIILLSIIALSRCGGNKTPMQKAKEDIKNEFTCYPDVLGISLFLDNINGPTYSSKKASKEINEICPQLDQTCCTIDQLNNLKESFLRGKEKVLKIKEIYWMTISLFKKHKEAIKKQFEDKKESIIKCLGKEQFDKRNAVLNMLGENIDSKEEKLRNLYNSMLKYFSGYACELCGKNLHYHAKVGNNRIFIIHIDNLKTIIQNLKLFLGLTAHLFHFRYLSDAIGCSEDENHKPTVKSFLNADKELREGVINCSDFNRAELIFKSDFCNQFIKYHGLPRDSLLLKDIHDIFYEVYNQLSTFDNGSETKTSFDPIVTKEIEFYQFIPQKNQLNGSIVINKNEGINLANNPMDEEIWNGIYLLSISLLGISLMLS